MDHKSFDRLARLLGAAGSRRAALAALLGAGSFGAVGTALGNKRRKHRAGRTTNDGDRHRDKTKTKTKGRKNKQQKSKKQRSAGPGQASPAPDEGAVAAEAADCLSPGPSSNLNFCDFTGADFAGVDLSGSSMRGTRFRGANLCGAKLFSSQLRDADFRGLSAANRTNLTRADLHSSGCAGTKFDANSILCQTITCNGTVNDRDCPAGQVCCDAEDCPERVCRTAACQSPACVYAAQPDGQPGILCPAPRQCCDGGCCGGNQQCCGGRCIAKDACCTDNQKGCGDNQTCCGGACVADDACCTNGQTGCAGRQECCNGICIGEDECCPLCPDGQTCTNGACCPNERACGDTCCGGCGVCDPAQGVCVDSCPSGCCAGDGTCRLGTSDDACGGDGASCQVCTGPAFCHDGACVEFYPCTSADDCPIAAFCEGGDCVPCDVCDFFQFRECDYKDDLHGAIEAARAGATIRICPGNYADNLVIDKDLTLIGAGDRGPGRDVTTVSASGEAVITVDPGADVRLERLVIARSQHEGIFNRGGSLTLRDVTVRENEGSGVFNWRGELTGANVTIAANEAPELGGGIRNGGDGRVRLTDSTISDNRAETGGGIHNGGSVTLINCTVARNRATHGSGSFDPGEGGGIYNDGTLALTGGAVRENHADRDGGGVHNLVGSVTNEGAEIRDNTPNNCTGGVPGCTG